MIVSPGLIELARRKGAEVRMKFLNTDQVKEEEKSAELLDAMNRIAALELRVGSLSDVLSEMAMENARLRVELAGMKKSEAVVSG